MKKESKPASNDPQANHQTRKPPRNPTTNYALSPHKAFCRRCLAYNQGCPKTGRDRPTRSCAL